MNSSGFINFSFREWEDWEPTEDILHSWSDTRVCRKPQRCWCIERSAKIKLPAFLNISYIVNLQTILLFMIHILFSSCVRTLWLEVSIEIINPLQTSIYWRYVHSIQLSTLYKQALSEGVCSFEMIITNENKGNLCNYLFWLSYMFLLIRCSCPHSR